jgi:hypothetical protein
VVHGLAQLAHEPESTGHANVEPPSDEETANVGVSSLVVPVGEARLHRTWPPA